MKLYITMTDENNPHKNLAFEETLLSNVEKDSVWMYLWQNEKTVVIGRHQNPWYECRLEVLETDCGTLARRTSGGGTVFHDLGNLNFSFITDRDLYDLDKQLKVIIDAVNSFGIKAKFTGRNDITVDGKKFSGNAFAHIKGGSLHHGTLLINADLVNLGKYLSVSVDKMKSKGIKSVKSRVCNLNDLAEFSIDDMKKALCESFEKIYDIEVVYIDPITIYSMNEYRDNYRKHSSKQWLLGHSPRFDVEIDNQFSWGGINLLLSQKDGIIHNVTCYSDAMEIKFIDEIIAALTGIEYRKEAIYNAVAAIDNKNSMELARYLKEFMK